MLRVSLRPIILAIIFLSIAEVRASSDAGAEVNAGLFQIKVTYSVADEFSSDSEYRYLTKPSGVLFDLIILFQKNYESLSTRNEKYWVDVSFEVPVVFVSRFDHKSGQYVSLAKIRYVNTPVQEIKLQICTLVSSADCLPLLSSIEPETFLYELKTPSSREHPNAVLFGSFPSEQLSTKYVLRPEYNVENNSRKLHKKLHKKWIRRSEMDSLF